MNLITEPDDHLAGEDEPSADTLGETLSLADTPEEDADRYRDVIRELEEFEAAGVEGEAEAVSATEGIHDLDARPETTVA
jgi:hypothetical protein